MMRNDLSTELEEMTQAGRGWMEQVMWEDSED